MKKYIITGGAAGSLFNASAKAPKDIETILLCNGYTALPIHYLERKRGVRWFLIPIIPIVNCFKVKRCSEIVFQYAPITCHKIYLLIIRALFHLLRFKKVHKYAIIHDLASMRERWSSQSKEISFLNEFDGIAVHSEAMKDKLQDMGYRGVISILGLFDYIVDFDNKIERNLSGCINFSGNLQKSHFISHISEIAGKTLSFDLYGKDGTDSTNNYIHYNGPFKSNDLSSLKGSWGLVWDGDSINGLEGEYGIYLKYNSPHKASMYICAELPLIVSCDSAISSIVRSESLGLTVHSLKDIEEILENMDNENYNEIVSNVKRYSARLKSGANILDCLKRLKPTSATTNVLNGTKNH